MVMLAGALGGYVVASGVGVVFCEATPLPLVSTIWWIPIVLLLFLFVFRVVFHEELLGRITKKEEHK